MESGSSDDRLAKGEALYRRAAELIPGGTQTNSKRPPAGTEGVYPRYIARGQGPYVWDVDDNRYIDHKLGCGPVVLGHAYPEVVEAAARQMRDGMAFGSCHPSEVELAQLMVDTIPCAEMARFLKSGAEGTAAAIRLARAYTGRDLIVSCGYHGWHDWSLAKNPAAAGIPDCLRPLTRDLPYGDYERLDDLFRETGDSIAAVVFAAPYHDDAANIARFAQRLRDLTLQYGAVLVYDEIVTGFRVATGGLQELIGVLPDLAVFSKGMANGFPISAVVGRKPIMEVWERCVISSTFGGETAAIAAAIACIGIHRREHVTDSLAARGRWFAAEAQAAAGKLGVELRMVGFDALPVLELCGEAKGLALNLHRTLLAEGAMPYFPMWYLSYSHTRAVMAETLEILCRSLRRVVEGRSA